MFYQARWYDPSLNRFAQADSIVPGGVQGLDRYAAMFNNPIKYNDPSGHTPACAGSNADPECEEGEEEIVDEYEETVDEYLLLHFLCGGDENLYAAWQLLYKTASGKELAAYIYKNKVKMKFGAYPGTSVAECSINLEGCVISLNPDLQPSSLEPLDPELLNLLAAELGHEGYHMKYGRPWHENTNSQFEEFGAFQAGDNIYAEITGTPHPGYKIEGYNKFDRSSLQAFFVVHTKKFGEGYLLLPSYPPFYPYYMCKVS